MKNKNIPEYLRDLTREERELICRHRNMSEENQKKLSKDIDKHANNNLQSNAKSK